MKRIVPGQAKVFTIPFGLTLAVVAFLMTWSWIRAVGFIVLFCGAFFGAQATHLAQMEHSAPPPTWLERQQQRHRALFIILSFLVGVLGTWMALHGLAH